MQAWPKDRIVHQCKDPALLTVGMFEHRSDQRVDLILRPWLNCIGFLLGYLACFVLCAKHGLTPGVCGGETSPCTSQALAYSVRMLFMPFMLAYRVRACNRRLGNCGEPVGDC